MINISSDFQTRCLSFTIRSACVWHLDCAYKHTGRLVCNQRRIKLTAWGKVPPWHATRRRTGDRVPKVTSTDNYRKTGSLRVTTTHHSLPSLFLCFSRESTRVLVGAVCLAPGARTLPRTSGNLTGALWENAEELLRWRTCLPTVITTETTASMAPGTIRKDGRPVGTRNYTNLCALFLFFRFTRFILSPSFFSFYLFPASFFLR